MTTRERLRMLILAVPFCLLALMLLVINGHCQIIGTYTVGTGGNSVARYQMPFAQQEYPQLPRNDVWFAGQDGLTCQQLKPLLPLMARQVNVFVVYDIANDVRVQTPTDQLIQCLQDTITAIELRDPGVHIVLPNEHPWTQDNCIGDRRDLIDEYNAAIPQLASSSVTVVDVWTPNVLQDGSRWADPQYMTGFCGVHPGPAMQWSASWAHFVQPVVQAVRRIR